MFDNMTLHNNTSHGDNYTGVPPGNVIFIIILFLLAAVIIAGNVLTILAVHRTPRLRTVANKYVVSMAAADLMAGLVLPFYAAILFPGMENTFNNNKYLCLSHFVVLIISAGNSMVTMVLIAADRLIYIAEPMTYRRLVTTRRAYVVIATSWVIAVIIGTMPMYYNRWDETLDSNSTVDRCKLFHVFHMAYHIYAQFLTFCMCSIVSASCYIGIFRIARRQRRALQEGSMMRRGSESGSRKLFRREWPIIKMFILVFGVFFVCWCPAMVGIVLGNTVGIPRSVMDMFVALCLFNSGMNFFIYGWKNKDFKVAYKKILCGISPDSLSYVDSKGSANGLVVNKGSADGL